MDYKTLVFGCSGTIGLEFIKIQKKKNTLFFSRKKPEIIPKKNWKYIDLDKKIKNIPNKVNKIFFFSSPYYKLQNIKKKNYHKELAWIKKIIKETETKKFIYLSSSSVYLNKHPIGTAKLSCENFLINNLYKKYLQIWRPYNLISYENKNLSDHFHNILIKKFCLEGKKIHAFKGSEKDTRGYSTAIKFCKLMINKSNLNKNFIYNYGNSNTITVKKIANIFKKIFENKYKKKIKYKFNSNIKNINTIKSKHNIKSFNAAESSYKIIKKYYLSKINSYEK